MLPTPVSERWLSVAGMVKDNVILFGWNIPERFSCFKQFDFSKMDEVAQKNAVATAEGTLAETIKYSNRNISVAFLLSCIVFLLLFTQPYICSFGFIFALHIKQGKDNPNIKIRTIPIHNLPFFLISISLSA